jgi:hypothetical protein
MLVEERRTLITSYWALRAAIDEHGRLTAS